MNTTIMNLSIILVIHLVIITDFTHAAMKTATAPLLPPRRSSLSLHKIPEPTNYDIFIQSEDPNTRIQIQYATEEYSKTLARCYTFITTKRMKDNQDGVSCLVKPRSEKNQPALSFYEPFSQEKKFTVDTLDDFDEFTIELEENDIIRITKKNELTNSKEIEVARFTLKSKS